MWLRLRCVPSEQFRVCLCQALSTLSKFLHLGASRLSREYKSKPQTCMRTGPWLQSPAMLCFYIFFVFLARTQVETILSSLFFFRYKWMLCFVLFCFVLAYIFSMGLALLRSHLFIEAWRYHLLS